jgi:hypothetical protein
VKKQRHDRGQELVDRRTEKDMGGPGLYGRYENIIETGRLNCKPEYR